MIESEITDNRTGKNTQHGLLAQKVKKIISFIIKYAYAASSCLYLFTIGFLFAKNRNLISKICTHFGYSKKTAKNISPPEPIIPKVELPKILPKNISIQIPEPIAVDGNISFLKTIVINELIKRFNPKNIFEIGTFDGRSTLNMAANCAEETKIYTLDLPKDKLEFTKLQIVSDDKKYIDKKIIGAKYLGTKYKNKISQLYGDSATFDFSPFYNMVDFIFTDGSHSYEYLLNDSKQALKLLRNKQGIIIWHDYDTVWWDGVTRALNELYIEPNEFKNLKHICGTSFVCLGID